MAPHDIGQTRGGTFYDDFDDNGDVVNDNHEMMIGFTGFGANINPGLPWYGLHQCSASKNGLGTFIMNPTNKICNSPSNPYFT